MIYFEKDKQVRKCAKMTFPSEKNIIFILSMLVDYVYYSKFLFTETGLW